MQDNKADCDFTEFEKEILKYLITDASDYDIAKALNTDEKSIQKAKDNIKLKLNALSITQAIVIAYKKGLIK